MVTKSIRPWEAAARRYRLSRESPAVAGKDGYDVDGEDPADEGPEKHFTKANSPSSITMPGKPLIEGEGERRTRRLSE
ncbi:hypothetical protein NDU88_001132 [Pleurodeles waltl]|uniref:Uncharacterized protein n=1 Tax=Pleurodeles waltl TaxID=8319 RepID=A0AAV7U5I0_PLEWA|nr:hypothetical protein NDU88_001132 [Pleurodeles waltl]